MQGPKLIALDTSTEGCSAALAVGNEWRERFEVLPRGHAERILTMIDELLAEAGLALTDLDALAFCRGPGSFTGVRISAGVAQGLAYGAGLPVAPVSTLATIAQGAAREHGAHNVLTAVDARMGEIYWAPYRLDEEGVAVAVSEERVAPPGSVACPEGGPWHGAGTGWEAYGEVLMRNCVVTAVHGGLLPRALDCLPTAARMLHRGELVDAAQALPCYLRDRVTG